MKKIDDINGLLELSAGDKFYVVENGNTQPYIFSSVHPKVKEMIVAINDGNYNKATCFYKTDFSNRKSFFIGLYDSAVIGNEKISQLKRNIESIEKIYLNH